MDTLRVAFVVPLQGPTGLYGPSCLACGELAAEQLNATNGIGGRRIELLTVDGGRHPDVVAAEVAALVDAGAVEAVAGWHISAVRQAITRRIGGKVIYAYAAMHEGRDDTPAVFMLGERPVNQLLPATTWMREKLGIGRWAVVGNDYVFPRVTGHTARGALRDSSSRIVSETYVPLGTTDFGPVIDELEQRPDVDGVIMLLMGQDAVHFNRQFARHHLDDRLARLSPAIEENTLLAGGSDAHRNLYAAAAYFDSMNTTAASEFSHAYYARYGRWAPTLNAIGESCYEAVMFLARVGETCGSLAPQALGAITEDVWHGPRGRVRFEGNLLNQDVYVAAADELEFEIQEQIAWAG